MAENIINKLHIGEVDYDIYAASATSAEKLTTALDWTTNLSTLTATSGSDATSGIMTPDQIKALVNDKIAGVYTVKGTLTATVTDGAITNMPTDAVKGDVYNIALPEGTSSATLNGQTILNGDNVVYAGETEGWDKLAATMDLSSYATQEWVNTNYSATKDAVTGAVTTSAAMAEEGNTGKLGQVGAITGYVEAKVAETISETIDITDTISDTTPTSAIPNVGAVTGYVDTNGKGASAYNTITANSANWVNSAHNAYAKVVVVDEDGTKETTTATAYDSTIGFSAGTGISLTTTGTGATPMIGIAVKMDELTYTITGGNGITAGLVEGTQFQVSGIDATSSNAGVTKASYVDGQTAYIF